MKVSLTDICDFQGGTQPPKDEWIDQPAQGYVRMLQIRDFTQSDKNYIEYVKDTGKLKTCIEDDILIGRYGASIGKILTGLAGAYNVAIVKTIPDEKVVSKKYLYWYLNSQYFQRFISNVGSRAAQAGFNKNDLGVAQIPLVDKERQEEICEVLEKANKLISLRKQQLAKLDELIKARFVEMFGNIIRNDKSWPIHNFSDIASSRLGKMLDAKQQTGKYSYPYLANFNVQWFNFNVDNLNQMDFNEAEQKEFELRDGDLLVCEGGEIGRCAVWHNEIQPCFFQKALHRVRCNRQLVQPDYLAWWFKYNCNHGGFAEIAGAKATIAHLPGIKLKQLQVALPPLSLQNEFAAFVERVDQQKQTVQQSLEKLELMKKALMQEYFG